MRRLWVTMLVLAALAPPAAAHAAGPLGLACADQGDGIALCQGKVRTFDGVPLDVNLALPAGSDLPLVVLSHGYGGSKLGYADLRPWARRGYAVLAFSARGFGESCGSGASRLADPVGCAEGWVRLDDVRYEARDIQQLAGLLADAGVVDGQKVGVTGGSYGGGVSLDLAVLRDRVMLEDGALAPWTSPAGRPMQIAGAVPWIPWSDLVYALAPNGRTRDGAITSPTDDLEPFGIAKQSFVAGLYASGQATGYYAPPGADPDADLTRWFAQINAGEPYGADERAIADELAAHHSPYYLDHSRAPAPTLIASGWTDDLFPVDEAVRYYDRTRGQYPDAPLSLMFLDFGHQRGQNKDADVARFEQRAYAWMDRYVMGDAAAPALEGVEALTQTCPHDAPSGGPYAAPTWKALHPGEVRFASATPQTVTSIGGDPTVARAFDPIAGDGACATTSAAAEPGTADYRLPTATGDGYTLVGAPTVVADLKLTGTFPTLALRLLDVAPDGSQTLVARGLYRPTADGRQVLPLHPGAWRFAPGHVAKLQLLGRDAPYGRASNGTFTVEVRSLELRLPVRERHGAEMRRPLAPVLRGSGSR
jgi:predicted acyl esterase